MPRRVSNPPNPWSTTAVEWLEEPPSVRVEVFEEDARSALTENRSPDVPFRYSVNPYRGCAHACSYCYARTSHSYLDLGAGTDFDSKLVVKRNIAEVLDRELRRRTWRREPIAISGITDAYQPLEAAYGLTRACLEVCLEHGNPVMLITKAALIARDAELLGRLHRRCGVQAYISMPFLDAKLGRQIEPGASSPARRLTAMRDLSAAGVPVGVALAPLIPSLNDAQIPAILTAAAEAGATSAFRILLRLPGGVAPVFEERLRASLPERADSVLSALRDMGGTTRAGFGARMAGTGPRWKIIDDLFLLHCRRLGLRAAADAVGPEPPAAGLPPRGARQPGLFDGDT